MKTLTLEILTENFLYMLGRCHLILMLKFSPSHFGNYLHLGILRNHSKIASGGLWKRLYKILPEICFLFTKYQCQNAPKWPQMPQN